MASADRIKEAAQLVCSDIAEHKVVVVSAMGSHSTSLVKVTDVLLNMVAKASRQDEGFLLDLAAIQQKHIETAKLLLVEGQALNSFVSRLLDDVANLKAMLRAISIGTSILRSALHHVVYACIHLLQSQMFCHQIYLHLMPHQMQCHNMTACIQPQHTFHAVAIQLTSPSWLLQLGWRQRRSQTLWSATVSCGLQCSLQSRSSPWASTVPSWTLGKF